MPRPPANKLLVDGREVPCKPGWIQLGDTIGAHRNTRLGFQLETTRDWYGTIEWNGSTLTHLGPRSRRTLRYGEAIPEPYYIPGHGVEDFRDGGLHGMDLCGVAGRAHDWDRVHARCPVFGLIDIVTGRPRRLASIAMPAGGIYSLERVTDDSILPEYGWPEETAYNGQHDLRRSRWGYQAGDDEFVRRDKQAVARDMALAWNAAKAARLMKEPKGQGSPEVGREWAFVLIAALDAGDAALSDRLCAIGDHFQTSYGNLQINSGGNPAPPDKGMWFSDAEAHYQTVAFKKADMPRQAAKLAKVCVANGRKGKYIEVGTGKGSPLSDGGPTDGTAWGAMGCGVYSKADVQRYATMWKVGPDYNGAMSGPFTDTDALKAKLAWWGQSGKTRTVEAFL